MSGQPTDIHIIIWYTNADERIIARLIFRSVESHIYVYVLWNPRLYKSAATYNIRYVCTCTYSIAHTYKSNETSSSSLLYCPRAFHQVSVCTCILWYVLLLSARTGPADNVRARAGTCRSIWLLHVVCHCYKAPLILSGRLL